MGDETWASIQLVKSKRESFREKLKRRKAERDTILSVASGSGSSSPASPATSAFTIPSLVSSSVSSSVTASASSASVCGVVGATATKTKDSCTTKTLPATPGVGSSHVASSAEVERCLLELLSECVPPITSEQLLNNPRLKAGLSRSLVSMPGAVAAPANSTILANLLQKFAYKELISTTTGTVTGVQHNRLTAALEHTRPLQQHGSSPLAPTLVSRGSSTCTTNTSTTTSALRLPATSAAVKRPTVAAAAAQAANTAATDAKKQKTTSSVATDKEDVMSLLSAPSIRERENKRVGEEILELLNKPTAKEQSVAQHFRSQGGAKVREFCPRGTAEECIKWRVRGGGGGSCGKLHFRKILQHHTDESLGDCSFLNTCFHMDTCRYVHYEVDYTGMEELAEGAASQPLTAPLQAPTAPSPIVTAAATAAAGGGVLRQQGSSSKAGMVSPPRRTQDRTVLFPPQWIQCDLRFLDMAILGKFSVIMADPPWDIHMELPYGTMSDDEMRRLNIPALQDEGLIFLWVTGRAMELGRECLTLWGYERVDEIIWVKTNQLQRIIRTGRTGHWLNHGKEHCLVGMKGKPKINRCMDCDVIVAEVRATSHKPDEIYGIIERLSPGTRKIELFGRHHNVQPNWLTLGNQLEGVNLLEEDLIKKFKEHHPDGVGGKT